MKRQPAAITDRNKCTKQPDSPQSNWKSRGFLRHLWGRVTTINQLLKSSPANLIIVWVPFFFKEKKSKFFVTSFLNVNILWFLFSSTIVNWISWGWGQNKTFVDVILDFGKLQSTFSTIFCPKNSAIHWENNWQVNWEWK